MRSTLNPGELAEGRRMSADSKASEGTIPFGAGVKAGTNPEKQVAAWDGATGNDKFKGIAMFSIEGDLENGHYPDGVPTTVLRKGVIWVKLSDNASAVTAGDQVAIRNDNLFDKAPLTTGTSGNYGVELTNAEFKTAGQPGEVVKVEIDMPTATKVVQL